MEEKHDNVATIVVVGTWNRDIFTPDWVKENILNGKGFSVFFPLESSFSLKFDVDKKFSFLINGSRLEFYLLDDSESTVNELLDALRNILRCLVHTPIKSFGINFVYEENGKGNYLSSIDDTEKLKEAIGCGIDSSELKRSFLLNDSSTLNFSITQKGECATFNFNYHYNVTMVNDMLSIIGDDELIKKKKEEVKSILQSVYENG